MIRPGAGRMDAHIVRWGVRQCKCRENKSKRSPLLTYKGRYCVPFAKKDPAMAKTRKSETKTPATTYRRAGLLDVPLIFELIQAGAEAGAFSEAFVERTGSVKLLYRLMREVLLQSFQWSNSKSRYQWSVILTSSGDEVGVLKQSKSAADGKDRNLEILAICPHRRNQGIGTAVLERSMAEVPSGGILTVHCTKYARAMQHILKRQHLKRNVKFHVPRVEEYRSHCGELV